MSHFVTPRDFAWAITQAPASSKFCHSRSPGCEETFGDSLGSQRLIAADRLAAMKSRRPGGDRSRVVELTDALEFSRSLESRKPAAAKWVTAAALPIGCVTHVGNALAVTLFGEFYTCIASAFTAAVFCVIFRTRMDLEGDAAVRHAIFSIGYLSVFALGGLAGLSSGAVAAQEQVLYRFSGGSDGGVPNGGLIADAAGNLYGTTSSGGSGYGTVFELSPQSGGGWTETVLHAFQTGTDGHYPDAPLVADAAGNLYGTTVMGGSADEGTVFELTQQDGAWKEAVLYNFAFKRNGGDRRSPKIEIGGVFAPNGIVFGNDGNLYGLAWSGGYCYDELKKRKQGCYGGAFKLAKPLKPKGAWKESVLFRAEEPDVGFFPWGPPVFDARGNLYGIDGTGSVFALEPPSGNGPWTASTVYSLENPVPGLVFDGGGNLYGTTAAFESTPGTVYELTPSKNGTWSESTLFTFASPSDGSDPSAQPLLGTDGNIYGLTRQGGANGLGVAYELLQQNGGWNETVLYNFAGASDGATPQGTLLFDNGAYYGVTSAGGNGGCTGNAGCGTVFAAVP